MIEKTRRCLNDLRYAYERKVPLEKLLNSYSSHVEYKQISKEIYKNFCLFVYKTDLDNEKILRNLEKYSDYKTFINNQSSFSKFFIKRTQSQRVPKKKIKKYLTYSAHGHFQTKNPVSVLLNYIAMIPAYLLIIIIAGIGEIFENFLNIFKSENKK